MVLEYVFGDDLVADVVSFVISFDFVVVVATVFVGGDDDVVDDAACDDEDKFAYISDSVVILDSDSVYTVASSHGIAGVSVVSDV
jgi:hypothetical protein